MAYADEVQQQRDEVQGMLYILASKTQQSREYMEAAQKVRADVLKLVGAWIGQDKLDSYLVQSVANVTWDEVDAAVISWRAEQQSPDTIPPDDEGRGLGPLGMEAVERAALR